MQSLQLCCAQRTCLHRPLKGQVLRLCYWCSIAAEIGVHSPWHLTKGWDKCAGIVCILAAAGDRGQQAVSQVVQQLNRELLGSEAAQIQGSCKNPLAVNCMQYASRTFCLQVNKSDQWVSCCMLNVFCIQNDTVQHVLDPESLLYVIDLQVIG